MSLTITHTRPAAPAQAAVSTQSVKAEQTTAKQAGAPATAQTDKVEISPQGREAVQNTQDYLKSLQKKFAFVNTGKTSISDIPTTVTVSDAFLRKCMDDPEKAKYLEENLAALPDCVNSAVSGCLGTVTNLSYHVDADGNISVAISGTNDPDGKIEKENAEKKAKEKEEESRSCRERVAFNAEKRARQLAAARTPDQVRQIMALLSEDLSDCKAGLERGACDEEEIAKVEAMIRQAQSKMAQVAGNEEEELPGLSAFDLASLM